MTGSSHTLNVALVGVGLVGSEVLRQLESLSRDAVGQPLFRLVAVASSTSLVTGTSLQFTGQFPLKRTDPGRVPLEFDALLRHLLALDGPSVVVDCTASDRVPEFYPSWLRAGLNVVTANKKGFAGSPQLFRDIYEAAALSSRRRACVYHESTVGAGLPVISTLRDLVKTGDNIKKIEGVFSGTLSYIFNIFSPSSPAPDTAPPRFSQVVRTAEENGYTEPDPREDLNGMDVARKVTILARIAGLSEVESSSMPIANLVPEPLKNAKTAEEFMDRLPEFDGEFARSATEAVKRGEVLRYVGFVDVENRACGVKLASYPPTHPFAGLSGSDNIIAFTTARFPNPLVIRGAGAGAVVTAFGVLSDLCKVQERVC